MPMKEDGIPTISRTQESTMVSSSVAAGEVFHVIALTLSAAAAISPRSAGPLLVLPKYPRNAGCPQWTIPGITTASRSSRIRSSGSPDAGMVAARRAVTSPGRTRGRIARSSIVSR
jgi:hypothetical protein